MTERTKTFKRNSDLEVLLAELNGLLAPVERQLLEDMPSRDIPVLFIVGPLRSGSTLLMQWLAGLGHFAYPTNLMSRFYMAPALGAKIQMLLTDPKYRFKDELGDFALPADFFSENGKTRGSLSPNEFWYFWRRFLPFETLDYLPDATLTERAESRMLHAEIGALGAVFQRPFAMKAMIMNYNIGFLSQLFPNAVFLYTKRDPVTNTASALQAREKQYGDIREWYSFKIPEYEMLRQIDDPLVQTAGQIFCINRAVEKGLSGLDDARKVVVEYERFCENPRHYYDAIVGRINAAGYTLDAPYRGVEGFRVTRGTRDPAIAAAYETFVKEYA